VSASLYIPWFKLEAWEIPIGDFTIPIQPFGVLVAIGVLTGAEVAKALGKRRGISPDVLSDFITHVVLVGFLGAMVLNFALYRPDQLADAAMGMDWFRFTGWSAGVGLVVGILVASAFRPGTGKHPVGLMVGVVAAFTYVGALGPQLVHHFGWPGLSSYGGFIGSVLGLVIWKRRRRLPALPFADVVVFGLPFGWFFGRMGCFVVHDHPGRVTDFALAVDEYRFGAPPFEPRHDLGLYEVFWAAGCILVLLVLVRKKHPVGFFTGIVPLLYGPIRFFLDYLRVPPIEGGDVRYLGLTPAQYASIGVTLFGVAMLARAYRGPEPELPAEAGWPPPERVEGASGAAGTAPGGASSARAKAGGKGSGGKGSGGKGSSGKGSSNKRKRKAG
jgi:phosphatidylglycerol:prolipoprotein diacylglycerol transferase